MANDRELLINNIKTRMAELGIDQAEVARRAKQKPQAINRWLKGNAKPGLKTINALALALETTPARLLSGTQDEPTPTAAALVKLLGERDQEIAQLKAQLSARAQPTQTEIEGHIREILNALSDVDPNTLAIIKDFIYAEVPGARRSVFSSDLVQKEKDRPPKK